MAKNYLWVFIEKLGVIIIKFIFMMILARLILPKEFGVFSIVNYIIMTATVLIDSGMGGSLVRKKKTNIVDYSTVNGFNIIAAIIISILLFLVSDYLAEYYKLKEMALIFKVMSICLIFRGLAVIYIAYLTKKMLFKVQSIIFIASAFIAGMSALVLAFLHYGYWALVAQQIIEAILVFVFFRLVARDLRVQKVFSLKIFREHFSFGTKLSVSSFLDSLSINLIINQIKYLGNISYVGKYTQINRINELFIGVLTSTVDKAALPILVVKSESIIQMRDYTFNLLRLLSFIAYFLITYIICCAPEIVRIVLGKNWIDAAWMLKIITYCGFTQIIDLVLRSFLKAQGASDTILLISILKTVILAIILFLAMKIGTVESILNGVVVASILGSLMYMFVIHKKLDIQPIYIVKSVIKPLICALTTISIINFLSMDYIADYSIYNSLKILIINGLFIIIIYSVFAWILKISELHYIVNLVVTLIHNVLAKIRKS